MSKYMPSVEFQIVFEEDDVRMDLEQLSREVFMSWMPFMEKTDDKGRLSPEDTIKLVEESSSILPEFVTNFKGLKDGDGNAITLETVTKKVYFLPLVTQIIMELIKISQLGQGVDTESEEEKNSEGSPLE